MKKTRRSRVRLGRKQKLWQRRTRRPNRTLEQNPETSKANTDLFLFKTWAGLSLATALFHVIPDSFWCTLMQKMAENDSQETIQ